MTKCFTCENYTNLIRRGNRHIHICGAFPLIEVYGKLTRPIVDSCGKYKPRGTNDGKSKT